VIRWGKQHQGFGICPPRNESGNTGGWRGVAANWFKHNPCRLNSNFLKLIGDEKSVLTIAEHRDGVKKIAAEPSASLLKQGLRSGKPVKLLRISLPVPTFG
jgi:hypothetical protein